VARMRSAVAESGVARDAIAELLDHSDHNLSFTSTRGWEKGAPRLSDQPDGDDATGKGRLSH